MYDTYIEDIKSYLENSLYLPRNVDYSFIFKPENASFLKRLLQLDGAWWKFRHMYIDWQEMPSLDNLWKSLDEYCDEEKKHEVLEIIKGSPSFSFEKALQFLKLVFRDFERNQESISKNQSEWLITDIIERHFENVHLLLESVAYYGNDKLFDMWVDRFLKTIEQLNPILSPKKDIEGWDIREEDSELLAEKINDDTVEKVIQHLSDFVLQKLKGHRDFSKRLKGVYNFKKSYALFVQKSKERSLKDLAIKRIKEQSQKDEDFSTQVNTRLPQDLRELFFPETMRSIASHLGLIS